MMVNTNAGNHDHGSSKVKLKNLVDYNWEPKYYAGQLLAIHTSGKYLAYSIKGMTFIGKVYICSLMLKIAFLHKLATSSKYSHKHKYTQTLTFFPWG